MRQSPQAVSPMSNEGRNAYVVEHLRKALLRLLASRDIGDISISELCAEAGVGRASFYRNYESREDIVRAYLNDILREWTDVCGEGGEPPLSEQIRVMFAHFEKHRELYTLLNERGLIYLLKDVVIGIYGPKPGDEALAAYAKAFVAYSLYGWIEVWFQRGMRESAEEMASLFRSQGL